MPESKTFRAKNKRCKNWQRKRKQKQKSANKIVALWHKKAETFFAGGLGFFVVVSASELK